MFRAELSAKGRDYVSIFNLIALFGGLAMFLYGMRMMGDGLKESSGGALKNVMGKVTDTPVKAFFKVVIHEIMPGIISGALMAFTMSLDDFVISYFVYGPTFVTLPVEIYNYTKKPLHPKIYALFTLLFIVILLVMVLMNVLQARDAKQRREIAPLRKKVRQ